MLHFHRVNISKGAPLKCLEMLYDMVSFNTCGLQTWPLAFKWHRSQHSSPAHWALGRSLHVRGLQHSIQSCWWKQSHSSPTSTTPFPHSISVVCMSWSGRKQSVFLEQNVSSNLLGRPSVKINTNFLKITFHGTSIIWIIRVRHRCLKIKIYKKMITNAQN